MRRDFVAPSVVALSLALALSHTFDIDSLGGHPYRVFWAIAMIACGVEWYRVRQRDSSGTADRLGLLIGVLLWALGWALF